jgi:hypothetical protein
MLKSDGDGTKALLDDGTYGAAGKVNKVNGISPDASITDPTDPNFRNVKTDYVFATEAEFDAAAASIPDGATVVKLWEYPDNYAGFMVVPDYSKIENINRISTNNGTWTVDRTGFIAMSAFARNTSGSIVIEYVVNNITAGVYRLYANDDSNRGIRETIAVKQGDIVRIQLSSSTGTITDFNIACNFIPSKLVAKELPVVVEKNGSYSLDEVKTAETWIDGKPIYKLTFTCSITIPDTTNGVPTSTVIPNISTFVRSEITTSAYSSVVGNEQLFAYAIKNTGVIGIWGNAFNNAQSYLRYVTVYYTKTTD